MNWLAAGALGLLVGLVCFGGIGYLAVHPPGGYRQAMGYTDISDRPVEQQRRMRRYVTVFVVFWALATAAVAAWAIPALSK